MQAPNNSPTKSPVLTISHRTPDGKSAFPVEIPQLGLGVFLMKEDDECGNACAWALETGYRHLDTAAVYENERAVGAAVRASELGREEIFVTTKLRRGDALGYDATINAFAASMKRLDIDYVDLYLVHAPPEDREHRQGVWRAMEDLLETGQTMAIGVSNYGSHHLSELIETARYGPAVNQIEIHPWLQRVELRAATAAAGAVPMAYSPLARGHKVNDPGLGEIAVRLGCSPAQVAIKWCLDQGCITIPKSSNESRIIENFGSIEVDLSSEAEALAQLDEDYVSGWDPTTQP
jgi:diketogulonate reductase-like aldo/keto reductase